MWEVNLEIIVAFVVGTVAVGRLARLMVDDDWPPVMWLRGWYIRKVPEAWAPLVTCAFCVAPWAALPNLLIAWASGLAWYWWVPNLWLASAYLGAILNGRDIPSQ